MSKKIILFPFGGNAREALQVIRDLNRIKKQWDVVGFTDDDPSLWGKKFDGVKVLGGKDVLKKYREAYVLAVPGRANIYLKRKEIINGLKVPASRSATIIHPTVIVSNDAQVGYNTLIMPYVMVSCGVKIGNHCVMLPQSVVSHDTQIGDYSCVGSNVSISGFVHIKENCYVGSGAKIKEDITIEEKSLVGLGSVVIKDVPPGVTVAGNPAKILHLKNE